MILEVAILDVIPERTTEFERFFSETQGIISSMKGYISHRLQKCLEKPNRYILPVNWVTLDDLTQGLEARRNIRNGDDYCTTSTIRFQKSSTIEWSAAYQTKLSEFGLSGTRTFFARMGGAKPLAPPG